MSFLDGEELELRAVSVSPEKMVLLRHHLEASEGLGYLVARQGGDAYSVSHRSQKEALDRFIDDLRGEVGLRLVRRPGHESLLKAAGVSRGQGE